jgi:hypothetical protein
LSREEVSGAKRIVAHGSKLGDGGRPLEMVGHAVLGEEHSRKGSGGPRGQCVLQTAGGQCGWSRESKGTWWEKRLVATGGH